MRSSKIKNHAHALIVVLVCCIIGACGGGGGGTASPAVDGNSTTGSSSEGAGSSATNSSSGGGGSSGSGVPPTSTSTTTASTVTKVEIVNTDPVPETQSDIPITFAQVFRPGEISTSDGMSLTREDGTPVPFQLDVKARNADGSLRHGIFSIALSQLGAGESETITLSKTSASSSTAPGISPATLLTAGFTASVNLNIGGTLYTASADELLASGSYTTWLSGPLVNEWIVSAPVKTSAGVPHPHLSARFAIRSYAGINKARVDVVIENDWAYEPTPQNFTYDANIVVGGNTVYSKTALTHYHHARWRKIFWWGGAPMVEVKHDSAYLMASKAVPNYDTSIQLASSAVSTLKQNWDNSNLPLTGTNNDVIDTSSADHINPINAKPMWQGIVYPRMPTTGGRPDIAPLPQWAVLYLLTMDHDAKTVTLGVGDLAGSWPVHYRDKTTGLPVSLIDHPYMTIAGHPGDAVNPATHLSDAFPACASDSNGYSLCNAMIPVTQYFNPYPDNDATTKQCLTDPIYAQTKPICWYNPESAHEPSLAFVPYLVTGDYYYLEELQFWANWNIFRSNPYYRGFNQGLVISDEVRGQAWSLRTLGQVAYITPDSDPMKQYFVDMVENNLTFYNDTYAIGNPNQLGVLDGSGNNPGAGKHTFASIIYTTPSGASTGVAPWQDDFFTWSVGYLADLGFTDANPLLAWKAKFPVGRMMAPGYCWIDGAAYEIAVRPSASSSLYSTFAEAYQATMRNTDGTPLVNSTGAKYLDQACGSQAQADWRTQYDHDNHTAHNPWAAGEMTGYANTPQGFPSNMQPALAVAAASGIPNAQAAWNLFMSRSIKPDYSSAPQFAIVPRN